MNRQVKAWAWPWLIIFYAETRCDSAEPMRFGRCMLFYMADLQRLLGTLVIKGCNNLNVQTRGRTYYEVTNSSIQNLGRFVLEIQELHEKNDFYEYAGHTLKHAFERAS